MVDAMPTGEGFIDDAVAAESSGPVNRVYAPSFGFHHRIVVHFGIAELYSQKD